MSTLGNLYEPVQNNNQLDQINVNLKPVPYHDNTIQNLSLYPDNIETETLIPLNIYTDTNINNNEFIPINIYADVEINQPLPTDLGNVNNP